MSKILERLLARRMGRWVLSSAMISAEAVEDVEEEEEEVVGEAEGRWRI